MTRIDTYTFTKNIADGEFVMLHADASRTRIQMITNNFVAIGEASGIINGGAGGLIYSTGSSVVPLMFNGTGAIWAQVFADGTTIRLLVESSD